MRPCPFPLCENPRYDWAFCCTKHFDKMPQSMKFHVGLLMQKLQDDDISMRDFMDEEREIILTMAARDAVFGSQRQ